MVKGSAEKMVAHKNTSLALEPGGSEQTAYRKKLYYISTHRGTKEGDLLVGGFARCYLETFTEKALEDFESLLEFPDALIFQWAKDPSQAPCSISRNLLEQMGHFLRKN